MPRARDPLRIARHVVPYVALYFLLITLAGPLFLWLGDYVLGITASLFFAAVFVNWLAMRIFENRPLADIGLWWNRASADNLALGLAGGMGAVCLALLPALAAGLCRIVPTPGQAFSLSSLLFVSLMLVAGAAGEELFFRGYGFQELVATAGAFATVVPVGVVFALLHLNNPNAGWFAVANTAGFGILFGLAYLRTRDLWLPLGLHFGWNFTLLLFGVPISGLTMNVTGHSLVWSAGRWWSGGAYGLEASVLTSGVLVALFAYLYKAPVRRQSSPLTDPQASAVCEEPPALPS
jgi:membrane protease YdiL (CAAX protease family)